MRVLLQSPDGTGWHPEATTLSVPCPDGWRRVWRGIVIPGDRYLNAAAALHAGRIEWFDVEAEVFRARPGEPYTLAHWYACLIRKGGPGPDEPCERCQVEVQEDGKRFCWQCCQDIIKEASR